ncbi:SBBP repeat-containing protein [Clostridium oryzae]|uniref:Beta-propeller repeat protein n=1 Tax=Clostridium oryzae TaxID=1450648 RepID=A0A1V4I5G1_9CLOT|nr:SBBP repeat-containing protein [Clostridium oryzae]OPJ55211.1 beta-propeller repeat protein [Clostridium oryzae]
MVEIKFAGANKQSVIEAIEELPGKVNYFLGSDPAKWYTNIPTYSKIKYHGVYTGIDVICYGNSGKLEYDYIISPNADPKSIIIDIQGADNLKLDNKGYLILHVLNSEFCFKKPYIYQIVNGIKSKVTGSYIIRKDGTVGFKIGHYHKALQLVIDPLLEYSTYLGGSEEDYANSIAVDSVGNAYITGGTESINFPTNPPSQPAPNSSVNSFITKINSTGSQLIYSTYLGGNGDDIASSIKVDVEGNAYITGFTKSSDFPINNALQKTLNGTNSDIIICKIGLTQAESIENSITSIISKVSDINKTLSSLDGIEKSVKKKVISIIQKSLICTLKNGEILFNRFFRFTDC